MVSELCIETRATVNDHPVQTNECTATFKMKCLVSITANKRIYTCVMIFRSSKQVKHIVSHFDVIQKTDSTPRLCAYCAPHMQIARILNAFAMHKYK